MWRFLALTVTSFAAHAAVIDLPNAVVLSPAALGGPENQAVRMLVEEVAKRTQVQLPVVHAWPAGSVPVIVVTPASLLPALAAGHAAGISSQGTTPPEGYRIQVRTGGAAPVIFVVGNDPRGVLFGVGHLLRSLHMRKGAFGVDDHLQIATAPKYRLRGHQLGFRPKTNSYDGWSVPVWEQYIRDLAVFGTNAIELIPPRSDDASSSPHFPLPPMPMMIEMDRLAASYGLDVWIWYPAMDEDYGDPNTVNSAVHEWGEVFRQLPSINAVFVPGGDPGHAAPRLYMQLLERQAASLRRYHPKAQVWASSQNFSSAWLDEFYQILNKEQPSWLNGVVFGPGVRVPLADMRAAIPQKYQIRHYPDITHSRGAQYAVPDWDFAYAVTEGREPINPRPQDESLIFRSLQPYTIGFITYSEGCNDDVNKIVWSALGWDPEKPLVEILREYSRYFIGDEFAEGFAQGLFALERNWRGPLLTNGQVDTTLQQFRDMERLATPQVLENWRFQQALYRAYYDAYTRRRLLHETAAEASAIDRLRTAREIGSIAAMSEAEAVLKTAVRNPPAPDLRSRVFSLAEALFQSIRMQLSVEKYQAIAVERGANLDSIDVPLNNRLWLHRNFAQIRRIAAESDRLQALDRIVHWTDPGPGGFYDDLGNLSAQPHLVPTPGFDADPGLLQTPHVSFDKQEEYRTSWWTNVATFYEAPLKMYYPNLDPAAQYRLKVAYAGGETPPRVIRLVANDGIEIHGFIPKPPPSKILEFDIPKKATEGGSLTLTWYREPGLSNGRDNQVAEVWLIRR